MGDNKMQIRHTVVEYDLEEAAAMLNIPPADLKKAVDAGYLQCYYRRGKDDYRFHEASLRVNTDLLLEKDYLTNTPNTHPTSETTTAPDDSEADRSSTPPDQ